MVSIVLVTYNRASRLKLSIRDILNQSFKDFELIICDDCSTDSTEQVCRDFEKRDSRIRYFRHDKNLAMPANCNFGINKSSFDYVAILHDGDRFKPTLIEQWYNAISTNDSVGFVFNSIGETDEHEQVVNSFHEFNEGVVGRDNLLNRTFFRRWKFDSPVYGQAMVKKSLLEERGYLSKEYGFYSDVDLWMDILHKHDAYYCADTLITCPTKEIQPRLFEDHLINHFLLMFNIQLKHRRKEFKNRPLELSRELLLLMFQSFSCLTYCLLLIVKNFSFRSYIGAGKLLRNNYFFLIPWMIILIAYPLLYPVLGLFKIVKNFVVSKLVKKEPVRWLSWLNR
jgi:glycosyltransferase involved in cell wall biosynthesis